MRQLLIESLLLAFVAWVLAVGFSWLVADDLGVAGRPVLPYWRLKMDARLLGDAGGHRARSPRDSSAWRRHFYAARRADRRWTEGRRALSTPPKMRRWTHALLVGQFALTLALLNGAGLTAKTVLQVSMRSTATCRRRMRLRRSFDCRRRPMRRPSSGSHFTSS